MKIALMMGSLSRLAGGLLEANRRLTQGWDQNGDDVQIFGVKDRFTDADAKLWAPLKPITYPYLGPARFGYAPQLDARLSSFAPDVLHSQGLWTYTSLAASRWKRRVGGLEVIHPHGMMDPWALRNSAWKKRVMAALFERRHLLTASCLRALCQSELESIRQYGFRGPVCVVPNGMDVPEISTQGARHPNLPKGKKVLLYLGRLHPKKGLANLIRAWATLPNRHSWILVIAGWDDGGHSDDLKKLVAEVSVEDDVTFLGPQFGSDKEMLYRGCEAFVLPSFSEGLPMVVLEAWAFAKPVLMTPMCNLPEGFNGGAALSALPEVDSLVAGLTQMFAFSAEERERMGQAGRRLVQEQFSWRRVVEDLSEVNRWLVHGGSLPECVARL
ncbi:poly(glycerol-phosphate) alpha-glucosyltransferase [Prosthecobacter debontii]|uniref:Poly(Glycerol-phosphate) alpha-glucosyltransferase n=1 Tax=Prosthecobacter debontii TaxID=48467 RepID=A0A1T4YW61_9BACT|nr:glycosyltransferase [Prosthecobacter debontii]SKB05873.1 poly(glycerol-phosphate) alpha-glucosyltransferase [Prosthecobacter debontii]